MGSQLEVLKSYYRSGGEALDAKTAPVATPSDLTLIPRSDRYVGMTVTVLNTNTDGVPVDYWLVGGTANQNWVLKKTSATIEITGDDVEN